MKIVNMNFNFKIIIILFTGMLISNNLIISDSNKGKLAKETTQKTKQNNQILNSYQYLKAYNETIEYIKLKEGFEAKPYFDAAGIRTIGYGHLILENESFPENISKKHAEKVLIKDFQKAVKAVARETKLKGYKKLAIAHFVFMMGIGNFNKSYLKKLILADKPIDKELLKWAHYRNRQGKMVKSNYSYRIRQWEVEMYSR